MTYKPLFTTLLQALVGASVWSMTTIITTIHSEGNILFFGVPCSLFSSCILPYFIIAYSRKIIILEGKGSTRSRDTFPLV